MKKPYKYTTICDKTRQVTETNTEPSLRNIQTWEPVPDRPGAFRLVQTKTVFIDTRYEAKLRLYNYLTFTKNGLPIPRYRPFEGTEIGKSIPVLNF